MDINGIEATGKISATDSEVQVLLADGRTATIAAGNPLFADAAALPDASPPASVPESVSNSQARAALRAYGMLDLVETAIAAADADTRDAWASSPYIRRDSVLVASLGASLGLSSQTIDSLFIAAGAIRF